MDVSRASPDAVPRGDRPPLSPLVATVLKVAVIVVLAALLYVIVSGLLPAPGRVESFDFMVVPDGTNWSATFTSVPSGKLPADLYLVLRNGSGDIVLPRTSFANLSVGRWALIRAVYADATPGVPEVRAGDRLLLDRGAYPAGSVIEVSDHWSLLTVRTIA